MHMSMNRGRAEGRQGQAITAASKSNAGGDHVPLSPLEKRHERFIASSEAMCGLLRGKPHAVRWPRRDAQEMRGRSTAMRNCFGGQLAMPLSEGRGSCCTASMF